jgi:hypothetical protein
MNDMSNPPPPPRTPVEPDAMLTVTLQAQEWNVVFAALQELPMRVARPVFDRMMAQLNQ